MWREILEFGGKFCIFVHINTIQIGENWACFPGNKHFFILWPLGPIWYSHLTKTELLTFFDNDGQWDQFGTIFHSTIEFLSYLNNGGHFD